MSRPADWNSPTSRWGVIYRDNATCQNVDGKPGGVVALARTGNSLNIEAWVRDCTAAEMAGDFEAPVPNDTFTTEQSVPIPPAGSIRDGVPSTGATGQVGSNQWWSKVIDNIIAGQPGSAEFEQWKSDRCLDAIRLHQAQRLV